MLNTAKTLTGYTLHSLDGEIGKVEEFYFDDQHWTVRYLIADTSNWLTGREVLISPYSLGEVNPGEQSITIKLTKKQIEGSPSLSSDKPVSRQFEMDYYGYYGMPMYWAGSYMWGAFPYIERNPKRWDTASQPRKSWDAHLRSTRDVHGHHIQAADGEIGHVGDFIIDDETWAIRYLVVDTQNWWPGKKVLVSPKWIERVSWEESKVFINLSRDSIKDAPEYTDESLLNREYETALHDYYDRQKYWVDESAAKEQAH